MTYCAAAGEQRYNPDEVLIENIHEYGNNDNITVVDLQVFALLEEKFAIIRYYFTFISA